jgi:hypothetical protein
LGFQETAQNLGISEDQVFPLLVVFILLVVAAVVFLWYMTIGSKTAAGRYRKGKDKTHGFSLGVLAFFANMLFQPLVNVAVFHVVLVPVSAGNWGLNIWFWLLSIAVIGAMLFWIYYVWRSLGDKPPPSKRPSNKLQGGGWAIFHPSETRTEMLSGTGKLWKKNVKDWTDGYKKDAEIRRLAAMDHFCFRFASGFVVGAFFASGKAQPLMLTLTMGFFTATPLVLKYGFDAYKTNAPFWRIFLCRLFVFFASLFSTALAFHPDEGDFLGALTALSGAGATVVPVMMEDQVHAILDARVYTPFLESPVGKRMSAACSACSGVINKSICKPILASALCAGITNRLATRRHRLADEKKTSRSSSKMGDDDDDGGGGGGDMNANPVMQELGMSSPTDGAHKVTAPAHEIEMVDIPLDGQKGNTAAADHPSERRKSVTFNPSAGPGQPVTAEQIKAAFAAMDKPVTESEIQQMMEDPELLAEVQRTMASGDDFDFVPTPQGADDGSFTTRSARSKSAVRRKGKRDSLIPGSGKKTGRESVVEKGGATRPKSQSFFQGDTIKEGRLQKMSSGAVKRWQARFFRLAGHYLSYMPNADSDSSVVSAIDLDGIASCTFNGSEIMIGLPHEEAWACSYRLKAKNNAEAVEWSNAIRAAAGMKQRLTPGPKAS